MSDTPEAKSAYVLEKTYNGQTDWSLFFVYSQREHIRALLQDLFFDNPDPNLIQGQIETHAEGESADLWLITHGRCTGHIDLRQFIEISDDDDVVIDWDAFDAAVPEILPGPPLRHGEQLHVLETSESLHRTDGEPAFDYPTEPIHYGMQVWTGGPMSDEPYAYYSDPDPDPAPHLHDWPPFD
ncbi:MULTISPECIES: hypothetical protein [unclassified Streptomyces]|uniref:hypothetical protein n=1 Tax=unclassified Streptomyces TaxID=2593676 RepID=UPI00336AB52B